MASSTAHQNSIGRAAASNEEHIEINGKCIETNGKCTETDGSCMETNGDDTEGDWEDFEVNIGWGTMRGKIRGSGPELMLGVHGWLDNANTFDLLAPHLPKNIRFLSLDLPGHGRSDHFPPGFIYDPRGYMAAIKRTITAMGWKSFTYLGHSMGAVVGIMYTAVFPEDVKAFISIDIIKPNSLTPERKPAALKKYFLQYFDNENKASQPPLVYQEEELVKKTIEGSNSLDERGARILLQRGARRVKGGMVLTRDLRVKSYFIGFTGIQGWKEMAKNITCPLLIVKAQDGHMYDSEERYQDMLEAFRYDCQDYQYHEVEGKHHAHLTNSGSVAAILNPFLDSLHHLEADHRSAPRMSHLTTSISRPPPIPTKEF